MWNERSAEPSTSALSTLSCALGLDRARWSRFCTTLDPGLDSDSPPTKALQ